MATALEQANWIANEAGRLAGRFPYVFGGGHGVAPDRTFGTFPPTKGEDPEGTNPKGYDCSGWVSAILWHGGVLGQGSITDTSLAPGTEELEGWGQPGLGKYVTVFVRDSGGVHHCVMKLTLPGKPVMWTAGAHTGTICGWQNYGAWNPSTEGYVPRHPLGL